MAERKLKEEVKYEYGADLEAQPQPILDPASGKTLTIRSFDFIIPPKIDLDDFPIDKQKIFSDHLILIKTMLWADGLVPYEGNRDIAPKVVVNLKARKFRIIVVAQARSNTLFVDRPKPLHEMLTSKASKNGTSRHPF